MARIRSLRPEVWDDEAVGSVCRDARLLFVGLITQADDEGRFRARSALLRARVFPYDDLTAAEVDAWLDALHAAQLIVLYEVDGERFGYLPGWRQHQKIDRTTPSRLPAPRESEFYRPDGSPRRIQTTDPGGSPRTESEAAVEPLGEPSSAAFDESSTSPQRALDEPSPPEGKGREGIPTKSWDGKGRENYRASAREAEPTGAPDRNLPAYLALLEQHHPRFCDLHAVERALFEQQRLLPDLATFESNLIAWSASEQWTEEGGRFAPKPARWIRDGGFSTPPPKPRPGGRRRSPGAAIVAPVSEGIESAVAELGAARSPA